MQAVGSHGCLTVYRGEGYCFHSLLRPKGAALSELLVQGTVAGENEPLTVEAKPKESSEPRQKDACHTLEELPTFADDAVANGEFERLAFPSRKREVHYHVVATNDVHDEYDDDDYGA